MSCIIEVMGLLTEIGFLRYETGSRDTKWVSYIY